MRVVAMIPVKMGSQRIPGKNIKEFFDGTPLVSLIQRVCMKSPHIDEVYVYCSDISIESYLEPNVRFLQRPSFLDSDDCNCNDIIREFIKSVDADVYVVSHATGPFTKVQSINACIDAVVNNGYDSAFLAKRLQAFLWQDGEALNFDPQFFPRTQDLKPVFEEASGAFVFPKETFIKYGRRVGANPFICEVDDIEAIDIDYPIDFVIADAIYKEIVKNECND